MRCKEKERKERAKEGKEEEGWKEMPGMQNRTTRIKQKKKMHQNWVTLTKCINNGNAGEQMVPKRAWKTQRKGGPHLRIDAVRSVSDGDVGHTASISRTSETNSADRDLVEKGEKKNRSGRMEWSKIDGKNVWKSR